ncbi:ribonuclease T2 family protein [Sphingobium fluviale]|uniref:Ribonuclease T n=1 Tax=Sphingobium fluviale TaxID=2506423 RepID=A0A4Q1KHL9_9SPHN|nr:ribonuclease T2 [Sphingobium fluviale]RXR29248.1 ribonuclease T [Sphingobium fluviale]
MRRSKAALVVGLVLAVAPLAAHAQAQSCTLPERINPPRAGTTPRPDEVRRMEVGGYTLALSWTPQYCARAPKGDMQCDLRNGRFGFVLHGLWPDGVAKDGRSGGWPQYCAPAAPVSRATIAANFCMMPSVRLMQHQWAKHGTCMARSPDAYFTRARKAYQALRLPDMGYFAAQYRVTAGQIAGAIARKNPGMTIDMIRVQASDYGLLDEVWICLDTGFRSTRCAAGKAGVSPNARIRVRSGY